MKSQMKSISLAVIAALPLCASADMRIDLTGPAYTPGIFSNVGPIDISFLLSTPSSCQSFGGSLSGFNLIMNGQSVMYQEYPGYAPGSFNMSAQTMGSVSVPEPSTWLLMLLGIIALAMPRVWIHRNES
jgi:PEP-CTERM motif-containing protein